MFYGTILARGFWWFAFTNQVCSWGTPTAHMWCETCDVFMTPSFYTMLYVISCNITKVLRLGRAAVLLFRKWFWKLTSFFYIMYQTSSHYSRWTPIVFIGHQQHWNFLLVTYQRYWIIYLLPINLSSDLTHLRQVRDICINEWSNIGSDNGLSRSWYQANIRINADLSFNGPLRTNFKIWNTIQSFPFKKVHWIG